MTAVAWHVMETDEATPFVAHVFSPVTDRTFKLPGGSTCLCVGGATESNVSYEVELQDVGFDDHGDTVDTATAIAAPNEPEPFELNFTDDVDFFMFPTVAHHRYLVQARGIEPGTTYAVLSGFSPNDLTFFNVHQADIDAVVYARVREAGLVFSGTVTVVDLGVFE